MRRLTEAADLEVHPHAEPDHSCDDHLVDAVEGGEVDAVAAVRRIANDTSTYYVLGYAPATRTLDGSLRKIDVRVKTDGLRVRARKGYLAIPLPAPMPRK